MRNIEIIIKVDNIQVKAFKMTKSKLIYKKIGCVMYKRIQYFTYSNKEMNRLKTTQCMIEFFVIIS